MNIAATLRLRLYANTFPFSCVKAPRMNAKQQPALKQLARKLSALRASSSIEERGWLDQLILGRDARTDQAARRSRSKSAVSAEVNAHQLSNKKNAGRRKHITPTAEPLSVLAFDPITGGYSVASDSDND
jgi:hypothetical protein